MTFVPPQTHRSNPAKRAVRTGKNRLVSVFYSTHPDFPDDLWDRLLPYAEITLNVLRPWCSDPTLSAWSGLHRLPYDFSAHPLHPPGQLCLALTHYRCQRVYVVSSSRSECVTLILAHFPLPLFHFAASDLPPLPTPDPSATCHLSLPYSRRHGSDRAGLQRPGTRFMPCCRGRASPSFGTWREKP